MTLSLTYLQADDPFPSLDLALPDGLLAYGADLRPSRLLQAYRQGIFPWCNPDDPLLWWSPPQRMVLQSEHLHVSHSMRKLLKKLRHPQQHGLHLRMNTAFHEVITACAQKREGQTWIAPDFIEAYTHLHTLGYAQSIETWDNDRLIGGLYGVSIGKMFFGESMFSHESNASKLALIFLVHYLAQQGVHLIDCQQDTPHLSSLGAHCIDRADFIAHLNHVCELPPIQWESGFLSPCMATFPRTLL